MSESDNATTPQADEPRRPSAGADSSTHTTDSSRGSKMQASKSKSRRESLRRRSSGLFAAARQSFVRSRGQSGASVETLRGQNGSDFEGYATVERGGEDGADAFDCGCLPSFLGGKKKDGLHFLLIKGYHCFVFKNEEGKSPKYAIELINRRATVQPEHAGLLPHVPHPGAGHDATYATVHLETALGDVEYKFTFAEDAAGDGLAAKFCNAVAVASNGAATEQARKRLGHEGLLTKRASVKYAEVIAKDKVNEQPEKPVGAGEVLAGMPSPYVAG